MYIGNAYTLLFFIYGLAFFSMGISAFQQRTVKNSNFPLLNAIKALGYFGITHGIAEWILLIFIGNQCLEYDLILLYSYTFLNALSFVFLWEFGIKLFESHIIEKYFFKLIPRMIFGLWLISFIFLYILYKGDSSKYIDLLIVTSRYFIGLPGGIVSCIALYKSGTIMENLKLEKIAVKFKVLALLFGTYGFLAGLIVSKQDFFPANIINAGVFRSIFVFPVEFARTIAAISITILFINVIEIFTWEAEFKIKN